MTNLTDSIVTEDKEPTSKPRPRRSSKPIGILILMIMVLALIGAAGYAYFQLAKVNVSLAHTLSNLQKQVTADHDSMMTLQQSTDALRQAVEKTQALSAKQEQMLTEWQAAQKGDLSKWHMAEAQYLVKLANDSLQFEYNSVLATILLKRAQQVLQSLQDPALLDLQKSVAADIANVEAAQPVNTTNLYLELSGLKAQFDQLPLPQNPLNTKDNQPAPTVMQKSNASWWQEGLDRSWQALSKIVIVRYNGSNALPLMLPEEKTFLFQNLHAQMESAMWAVLHRNSDIYQASLAREIAWIQQYFAQEQATLAVLQKLEELKAVNIQPPALNFSATLQLFDRYFADAGPVSATQ